MDRIGKAVKHAQPRRRSRVFGGDQHRMLNFKQFILMRVRSAIRCVTLCQEDEISPDKAAEEYSKYFHEFLHTEIGRYYDMYEHLAFFREKYHPYYLHLNHETTKEDALYNNRDFVMVSCVARRLHHVGQKYTNGHFEELLLEISFKRLYGDFSAESSNPPSDVPYKYTEWAYEIPLEYPKDNTHTGRLPIDSPLKSVLLVDVPDKVFKHEIQSALKPHIPRFSIYMAERDMVRTAFISVDDSGDLKKMSDALTEGRLTVQEFLLRFEPCNPLQERVRVRVCPPVCSHPIVVTRDVDLTGRVIRKLDADFCPSETSFVDVLPPDLDAKKRLDLHLTYLRRVHSYCYYGRIKGQSYIDLWDLCGPGHVRVDMSNDVYEREAGMTSNHVSVKYASWESGKKGKVVAEPEPRGWEKELVAACEVSKSQLQWLRDVESFAEHLLGCDLQPPQYSQDEADIEEKWKQFCNINTLVDGPERFRCRLCHKLFNDSKFVWKHLKLKHGDCHSKIVIECGVPKMREIFVEAHKAARCNPFERLLTVPVVQVPPSDVDAPSLEFNGLPDARYSVRADGPGKRRRRDYFDFDRPQAKRVRFPLRSPIPRQEHTVSFAQDEYSRPSVKYDDL
ncbi:arsenite-resistance protein 2 [Babesia caballi]|uniref:Arsenite-resistance protein 2 n=1 Tax=Babesia caballi TaxID=5871 RepID=A0AAV4LRA2_BABCB|nr:arsenite-resistance protein 2 [Babesia caballi]